MEPRADEALSERRSDERLACCQTKRRQGGEVTGGVTKEAKERKGGFPLEAFLFDVMALTSTSIQALKGSHDDPMIDSELVPLDLHGFFEILKTKFKPVHKILKVIRPEPNLVHWKMMTGCGDCCWPMTLFMVVASNFNVQILGVSSTCPADDHPLGSLLIVAPLTTIWFVALNQW
ncbi:hypothetical protein AMTR_s00160p00035040 [Amborella trichopoda]|uniref:Uncharacterized protein n=1 Tax=Amborella trichopoda TaxID=13333 RepID=W1PSZ4_AMBTC|nr:hypothetical protein AMTR_s00160p00035040 [Amborella trichopoda]